MAQDLSKSLVIRSIKKGGAMMALIGPWLPIPYVAAAGQVIEKLPIEEAIEWGHQALSRFGGQEPVATVQPEVVEQAKPILVEAEHAPIVADQIARAVRSEPFEIALQEAVDSLPKTIAGFMVGSGGPLFTVGIWPTFVLEKLARLHFQSQLGGSVAAAKPEVAASIEKGLGLEAIQLLRLAIDATRDKNPPGLKFSADKGAIRIWQSETDFEWPDLGTLSPGYFTSRNVLKTFDGLEGANYGSKGVNFDEQRKQLLGRLGRMGQGDLEQLTQAWHQACEAHFRGVATNSAGLAQLKLPGPIGATE